MARNGWLTPDSIPAERLCRVLRIPLEFEYIIPAVMGALYDLTLPENWEQFGTVTPQQMAQAMLQMYFDIQNVDCEPPVSIPVGIIAPFAALSVPNGWLACDGSLVAKTDYPQLWDALGDWWGAPTETHFYLPDMRNRSPFGYDGAIPPVYPFGSQQGEMEHTLTVAEIPAHSHITYPTMGGTDWNVISGGAAGVNAALPDATFQTWSTGGGQAHNNLHPVVICAFIIYAGV